MKQSAIKTIIPEDELQSYRTVHTSFVITYFQCGIIENKNTFVCTAVTLFQNKNLKDLCLTQFHLCPVSSSSRSSGSRWLWSYRFSAWESCEELRLCRPVSLAAERHAPCVLATSSSTFCYKAAFNCWWASTRLVILSGRFLKIVSILIKNRARNTLGSDSFNYLFPFTK